MQPPPDVMAHLDRGERDALLLAIETKADLVLMDDRDGVEEAARLGLTVTGTLGLLDQAAAKELIDLPDAFNRLRATNFRVSPVLLEKTAGRSCAQETQEQIGQPSPILTACLNPDNRNLAD